jgi:iron only hydrogenase large subunit-like protein
MGKIYPVYTLINECHDCYKCVRECSVKAIRIKDGHASVMDDKCIACGHCVEACPSNAKRIRYDIDKAAALIKSGRKVIVSLAPSWRGVFDIEASRMVALLKKLGFYAVSETALGAQEVSIKTADILNRADKGLFISSACPVIVDYVRLYRQDFIRNIVPLGSPALTHAQLLKRTYGDDIAVVFAGPCIAKKNESDRHPELIDAALTFEELRYWIKEQFIDIQQLEAAKENSFVPEGAYEGALYPIEGGMNDTIRRVGVSSGTQLLNISSLTSFQKALDGLDPNELDRKIFVEALACHGGCINGPCSASKKSTLLLTSDVLENVRTREKVPTEPQTVMHENYKPHPVPQKVYPIEQIIAAMQKIGKFSEEDELNCGGCGYATCRDLAAALLSGDAEPSMCVSYMRKIAMKKAAAMLRCMPSATVMVDSKLRIIETNDAFMKMFCGDMYESLDSFQDSLQGADIAKIVDFTDILKKTLQSGKDVHKEHYEIKDKLYDISAFTVEPQEIAGAIITDVTQSEMNREKIALKAHEVINKNIATVQNIASLLGEHMVETELLLNSIAEDFDVKDGAAGDKNKK